MVDYAQWLGVLVTFLNLAIALTDKKIVQLFRSKGATSPKSALNSSTLNPFFRRRLRRLHSCGMIRNGDSDFWYLDEHLSAQKRKSRRSRLAIALVLLMVFVVLIAYSSF